MYQLYSTSQAHLDKVACCHIASFPQSLSSKLGFSYARRSLEWFLAADNRFLFHVENDGMVAGYCGGFRSMGAGDGSTSGMMQYAMKEAAAGMFTKPWLFFDKDVIRFYPLIMQNILRKVIPAGKPATAMQTDKAGIDRIGLVVIGVHPDHRGEGCFDMLMHHFEVVCSGRGIAKMTLSVKASNARAIAAYTKAGWQVATQTTASLDMYKMLPL